MKAGGSANSRAVAARLRRVAGARRAQAACSPSSDIRLRRRHTTRVAFFAERRLLARRSSVRSMSSRVRRTERPRSNRSPRFADRAAELVEVAFLKERRGRRRVSRRARRRRPLASRSPAAQRTAGRAKWRRASPRGAPLNARCRRPARGSSTELAARSCQLALEARRAPTTVTDEIRAAFASDCVYDDGSSHAASRREADGRRGVEPEAESRRATGRAA